MKFNFLQKQTSRREMLQGSATLAGSAFLLRAPATRYAQQAPSPADLLADSRSGYAGPGPERLSRRQRLRSGFWAQALVCRFDEPGRRP
jgi:hypothetical protein